MGANLGFASADFNMDAPTSMFSTGWGGGGKIARIRAGYALTPDLLVGLEYGVWRRTLSDSSATAAGGTDTGATAAAGTADPVDRYLGIGLATVTLYPHAAGFSMRLGLGYGSAWVRESTASGDVGANGTGAVVMVGFAYELWADDDFALGAQFDYGFLNGSDSIQGNFAHLTATATLYTDGF